MSSYPCRVPKSALLYRGIRPGWMDAVTGEIQTIAFMRRPINQRTKEPEKSLSVGVNQTADEAVRDTKGRNKNWKVGELLTGRVEEIIGENGDNLCVMQDLPKHACILNTPLPTEDEPLATSLAQQLIKVTTLLPDPT